MSTTGFVRTKKLTGVLNAKKNDCMPNFVNFVKIAVCTAIYQNADSVLTAEKD